MSLDTLGGMLARVAEGGKVAAMAPGSWKVRKLEFLDPLGEVGGGGEGNGGRAGR